MQASHVLQISTSRPCKQSDALSRGAGVLVVMPTYNEAGSIKSTVGQVLDYCPDITILVVDDCSPDGTGHIADVLACQDTRVHVIHRSGPRGLGPAYLAGFAWGLQGHYCTICEMDMDGSHRPQDLPRLLQRLDQADDVDVVIGSRRVAGGKTVGWPWYRDLISRCGSWYAHRLLHLPVRDATAGFRAYRASMLRRLDLQEVESAGYVFQIDMIRRVQEAGGNIVELPIVFVERRLGTSKMGLKIVVEAMMRVTSWWISRIVTSRRSR